MIMEAREFRIGNFALVDQVPTKLDITHLMVLSGYSHPHCKIDPIRLTEEWLVRFGFEKMDNTWYAHEWYNIERDERGFWLSFQTLQSSEIFNYVHQLQNLNFALTGEELKLNDK